MSGLEYWLKQATRCLSEDSVAKVQTEIREHYESAREAAMSEGAASDEADHIALAALGDAKTANIQYRNVLLTSSEARMLREGNWEARAVCSRPGLKWLLLALSLAALTTGTWSFVTDAGDIRAADIFLVGGIAMGLLCVALFLPIYTPSRGLAFRCVKWVVFLALLALILGPDALKSSWRLFSCLWPLVWVEWRRVSIRRKLPVAKWPRQLYL